MKTRTTLLAVLAALSAAFLAPVHAQVYKWTDERGGVHYSNSPPPDSIAPAKVATIPDNKVSTYAPLAAPVPPADAALKNRVEALEQELASERRTRGGSTASASDERRRAELEECARQRRVDCDRPEVLPAGAAPFVVVAPPRRRSAIVPTLPVPARAEPKVATAPLHGSRARRPL
jgi:hypothetical protein